MSEINLPAIFFSDGEPSEESGVQDWVERIRRGERIPPVVAMREKGGRLHVADGRKRLEAAKRCGAETVRVLVVEGFSPEAFAKLRQELNQGRH